MFATCMQVTRTSRALQRGIGYLWKAIVVDPEGIDSNYLYAEVLLDEKAYSAARDALQRASDAPVRPEHPEADRARKLEVASLLGRIEHRLRDLT